MGMEIRGESDAILNAIVAVLAVYEKDHPESKITVYRHARFSVWVRVIDPDLAEMGRAERNHYVWDYLDGLSDEEQSDVNSLLLITPDEVDESFGNMEFENPIPWT
jgi:hypothetical protein